MRNGEIKTEMTPNCLLCGHEGAVFYSTLTDRLCGVPGQWNFCRCSRCGLIWLNPRPVPEDIQRCYPDNYFTHEATQLPSLGSSGIKRFVRAVALQSSFGYKHLARQTWYASLLGRMTMSVPFLRKKVTMGLGARLVPYREGGRILDVGCGQGSYLALMKELGWDVAGIEIDSEAVRIAHSHFGVFVHQGTVDDAPFEPCFFDAVTVSHVIEHVADPLHLIRGAARFLKPGGRMIIVTPNVHSLGHYLFGKDWYPLDPPRHLVLFTPGTLREFFIRAGIFRQITVSTNPRTSKKVFRKFILVRKTGTFRSDSADASRRVQLGGKLMELAASLGNPILDWGEEIECVAVKV